jgi:hypothetical protein
MPASVYEPPAAAEDGLAASLRGFGPLGMLAVVLVLLGNAIFIPLSAILALVWARLARVPLQELGFARPQRWVPTVLGGALFGAAFKHPRLRRGSDRGVSPPDSPPCVIFHITAK